MNTHTFLPSSTSARKSSFSEKYKVPHPSKVYIAQGDDGDQEIPDQPISPPHHWKVFSPTNQAPQSQLDTPLFIRRSSPELVENQTDRTLDDCAGTSSTRPHSASEAESTRPVLSRVDSFRPTSAPVTVAAADDRFGSINNLSTTTDASFTTVVRKRKHKFEAQVHPVNVKMNPIYVGKFKTESAAHAACQDWIVRLQSKFLNSGKSHA